MQLGQQGQQSGAPLDLDPQVDENGFPTNPAYLEAQGLSVVDLNRAYVEANDQMAETNQRMDQLLQVLSDPAARAQFFEEYDRQMYANQPPSQPQPGQYPGSYPQAGQYPPQQGSYPTQRPTFPGGNPYDQHVAADPRQALDRALGFGNPIDNPQQVAALWQQVPEQYIRSLAFDLIREY